MRKFLTPILILVFFTIPFGYLYADEPIRILIVPGHDNEVWGAQYGNIKEADMNLALGTNLFNSLQKDKRFQVYITRDKNGYTKEFADYFVSQKTDIVSFKENAKKEFESKIISGDFIKKVGVYHNAVSKEISVILYGINKWVNEKKIDAVIHIHFNDYPRKNKWVIGKYRGFAVYMPEKQMKNSVESEKLAKSIFKQLSKKYKSSDYKRETNGLVSEQNLIALGSSDTVLPTVRTVLIEYGYIYDKKFRQKSTRLQSYKIMADFTAIGIKNYFFER